MPTTREARRHASPEARRAQILDAARTCLSRKGYHGTTMDDLVRESGLSKGSLYWHFESKEEVLLALFDRYTDEFFAAWDERAEAPDVSPVDLVVLGAELFMERIGGEDGLAQAWLGFLEHPLARQRMAELYTRSRAMLTALVGQGVARGELVTDAPDAIAAGLVGLVEGVFLQTIVDPSFDPGPSLRLSTEALLKGLAP
ncbi:MAG: TetR/AcrR family transcriptional regulator [Myxococcota bacterium]